ncbi:MAG: WYL domain-containing protein [Actinomycetia bacterium]|nr:WYL domain-containing protein [Actinomycetes bacterium]
MSTPLLAIRATTSAHWSEKTASAERPNPAGHALLTDDEAVAVALCLRTAGLNGLAGQGAADPALRAATKLEAMLPAVARERVRTLAEAIRLPDLDRGGVDTELLTGLAGAVAHRRRVGLAYVDRLGEPSERRVEPHRLVAWRRRWYLSAYDLDRADWRTFRLDRIAGAHVTTFGFTRRAGEPDLLTTLASRSDLAAYRHRVELLVQASLDELQGYAPYVALEPVDATTTRLTSGADHPEAAANWLLRLEFPFRLVGDDAVREALMSLRDRLDGALTE